MTRARTETLHIRRHEPDARAAVRPLYERGGYHETQRGVVGPFGCIHYERDHDG